MRLVWAPEATAAFFGGDADNFEYPRYCLDVTLVRVYEDGKPAQIEHFLEWSDAGAGDGELVFVSGNPGNTQRITTLAGVKHLRDDFMPYMLNSLSRMEIALQQYTNAGPEHYRRGSDDLFGVQNSRKAITGMLQGLQTPEFIERKAADEESLRSELQASSELRRLRRGLAARRRSREKEGRAHRSIARLPQSIFHHRQAPGPDGDRRREAKRRPAARVPRVEPRVAGAGRFFAGAGLRRLGVGQVRHGAGFVHGAPRRRRPARGKNPGRQKPARKSGRVDQPIRL